MSKNHELRRDILPSPEVNLSNGLTHNPPKPIFVSHRNTLKRLLGSSEFDKKSILKPNRIKRNQNNTNFLVGDGNIITETEIDSMRAKIWSDYNKN
mmetsp:Transcript_15636/g.13680  ORF Transcript_15636/g.13680 Transcript_15636/m.13680 type:complete len:96 (+) Transcript_15636:530-817(+)